MIKHSPGPLLLELNYISALMPFIFGLLIYFLSLEEHSLLSKGRQASPA